MRSFYFILTMAYHKGNTFSFYENKQKIIQQIKEIKNFTSIGAVLAVLLIDKSN